MRVAWREVGAVLLVVGWAGSPASSGYTPPFDTATPTAFGASVVLFVAYVYLARTLFRLPFAVRMAMRRYRHARANYQLGTNAALFDSFYRGFLDRRRWDTGVLAVLDRLVLLVIVLLACIPGLGALLVLAGGGLGVLMLLFVYIYTGRFALLVGDGADEGSPFRNVPNLRRPDDTRF